ncbi:DUF4244 domain-containing protein [Streptomyces qinzhouensis]|uniref:DUF4244 domain-containing protein n=1 Tax=Streptomyces qinzhouensis TaxID=2599401 RepID=A0A5B8J9Q5_9ACTN|nr:DUF4244 domain-containing protein [Streptomyces qinzhouensis]
MKNDNDNVCAGAGKPGEERPGDAVRQRPRGNRGAGGDRGMATAEYAVGTVAACALAAVLYRIVTGGSVTRGLESLIGEALSAPF